MMQKNKAMSMYHASLLEAGNCVMPRAHKSVARILSSGVTCTSNSNDVVF